MTIEMQQLSIMLGILASLIAILRSVYSLSVKIGKIDDIVKIVDRLEKSVNKMTINMPALDTRIGIIEKDITKIYSILERSNKHV